MNIQLKNEDKCSIFVNIFQNLKLFTTNININISEDKFYIQGLDSSHVSIFELNLLSSWFDNYVIEKDIVMGVNCNILSKLLNARGAKQNILLKLENDLFEVDFITDNDNKEEFNKYFKIPLIDNEEEMMTIPPTEYHLNLCLSSKKFKSLIDQLSIFGDTVNIEYNSSDDKVKLISESSEQGEMRTEIGSDEFEYFVNNSSETDLKSSYAARYIHYFTQFQKISNNVFICIQDDIPLKVLYSLSLSENNDLDEVISNSNYLQFFLAPKISDDE